MKHLGYLIVLKPEIHIARYESSEFVKKAGPLYDNFRRHFSWLNSRGYRGISRSPLGNLLTLGNSRAHLNEDALKKLSELLPEATVDFDEESLIDDYEAALEVYGLLKDQFSWEIIEVRREKYALDGRTLGFDVGYWNSDHFSLIADTAVTPMWHGPAPVDCVELAARLSRVNDNVLFSEPSDAGEFRTWYKTKKWAEVEARPVEFAIIEVRSTGHEH